ncbi:hypothetical protein BE221DRAFT_76009 [Ostreococcus tauri]|uniref:Uncharacterized protein n=1 Tax=Ostreococcus tauri TaxID=70448 RepID=A0A1Y5IAX0_OSTTA|nr:hypothetical protein BE221DRAFT_76009 [Ostreococcus tauri]
MNVSFTESNRIDSSKHAPTARCSVCSTPRKCMISSAVTTHSIHWSSLIASRHFSRESHFVSGDANSSRRVAGSSKTVSRTFCGDPSTLRSVSRSSSCPRPCSLRTKPTVSAASNSSCAMPAAESSIPGSAGPASASDNSRLKSSNNDRIPISLSSVVGIDSCTKQSRIGSHTPSRSRAPVWRKRSTTSLTFATCKSMASTPVGRPFIIFHRCTSSSVASMSETAPRCDDNQPSESPKPRR